MVHSVYSEKSVFLRELISNAADACERLRYEAIAAPALLGDDPKPRITITLDADKRQLTVEDNGIGMSREEMIEALGTIARSGTKAFLDRLEAAKAEEETRADRPVRRRLLFGLHGGGPRRGRSRAAPAATRPMSGPRTARARSRSSAGRCGRGAAPRHPRRAASHGGRQGLHRALRPSSGWSRRNRAMCRCRSRSSRSRARSLPKSPTARRYGRSRNPSITPADYTDFYRSIAGQFDEPALTIHFHAEGRHEYTVACSSCPARGRSICSIPTARAA